MKFLKNKNYIASFIALIILFIALLFPACMDYSLTKINASKREKIVAAYKEYINIPPSKVTLQYFRQLIDSCKEINDVNLLSEIVSTYSIKLEHFGDDQSALNELMQFYLYYDAQLDEDHKFKLYLRICTLNLNFNTQFNSNNQLVTYFKEKCLKLAENNKERLKNYYSNSIRFNEYLSETEIEKLCKLSVENGNELSSTYFFKAMRYRHMKDSEKELQYILLANEVTPLSNSELGVSYRNNGNYAIAEKLLKECYSINNNDTILDYIIDPINLAKLYIQTKQFEEAEKLLNIANSYSLKVDNPYYIFEVQNAYSLLFEKSNDKDRLIASLKNELNHNIEYAIQNWNAKNIDLIYLQNFENTKYNNQKKSILYFLLALISVGILVAFSIIQIRKIRKARQEKKVIEFELIENQEILKEKVAQITNLINISNEKNSLINKISYEIKTDAAPQNLDILVKNLKNLNNMSEDWKLYQTNFSILYPDFFQKLLKINNELTDLDLKHASYIKLNLSTNEVATMLNINNQSVATFRYRLKQKLFLDKEANLRSFIMNL